MFYIYHIPERNKIGATDDVTRRMRDHKWTGFYEILEEHDCIYKVSDREIELQKEYKKKFGGYKVDKRKYHEVRRMQTEEGSRKGALNQSIEDKRKGSVNQSIEDKRKGGSLAYKSMRKLTYEQAKYIRAQYKRGKDVFGKKISMQRLANAFNVDRKSIHNLLKNRTYTTP